MATERNYSYIRAWHIRSGAMQRHIERVVSLAWATQAPHDAVYIDDGGKWVTLQDIPESAAKIRLVTLAEQIESGVHHEQAE